MKTTHKIIILACVLCLAIADNLDDEKTESTLYKSEKNKTYYIETRYMYNWFEASVQCTRENMTLLTIDTPEKSEEITNLIKNNFKENEKPLLYIGAHDLAKPNQFTWISTGKDFDFTNWAAGEPNNYNNNEHCVHIGLYGKWIDGKLNDGNWNDGKWNDVDCSRRFGYICEIRKMKHT